MWWHTPVKPLETEAALAPSARPHPRLALLKNQHTEPPPVLLGIVSLKRCLLFKRCGGTHPEEGGGAYWENLDQCWEAGG